MIDRLFDKYIAFVTKVVEKPDAIVADLISK